MDPGTSLANLGELSKPATVLIEKIGDAIGGFFRPYQVRRIASAEADARKIEALAAIEISELQQRALRRFVAEEARKQDNIESITAKALPSVSESACPEAVEDDWITNFFDKCRLISNDDMQNLWAKILAGEANAPGRYSKRTVDYLASLDRGDAELFRALCGFSWDAGNPVPMIFDPQNPQYTEFGITFSSLTHLDAIGLVRFESISGFSYKRLSRQIPLSYFSARILLALPLEENNELDIGQILLTKVGVELASVCGRQPVHGYFDYAMAHWIEKGITISSPWPAPPPSDPVAVGSPAR
jgi:hypothetical protein